MISDKILYEVKSDYENIKGDFILENEYDLNRLIEIAYKIGFREGKKVKEG